MLLPVGIRLPHMLDPVAEAGERAARLADAPPRPIEPPSLRPNPSLSVDPVTGLVVMEFRNLSGEVTGTVPTARELAAYRAAALTNAPLPPGAAAPTSPAAASAAASGAEGQPTADQGEQPHRP
jgi:hypothetical protein